MTNEMRAQGIKVRFAERTKTEGMKDSTKLATQADLYRIADETSTVLCMLAEAMDRGLAEYENDGLDKTAFILGAALGAVIMLGVIAVIALI